MAKPKIYQVDQLQTTIGTVYNQANAAYSQANTGGGPKITSLIYPGNDLAANTVGGQTVYVVGSGFASNAAVYINGNSVPSVSYISAGNLSITTPALSTGTYPVYVINPADGGTAIRIPGLLVSGEPTWNTAAGSLSSTQDVSSAWSYTLSATGDAPITYALAAGSSLPTGVSLNANGVISGTISSPPGSDTTYTFSVVASDAQLQDSTRQFSVTVTTGEGKLFANNVLLLHADGTNNGTNHSFLDSSNNNFTITRNGNATQGTFSPFSQTGWSAYFDGSTDSLTATNNAAYDFGSGAFTIEAWLNPSTGSQLAFAARGQTTGYEGWILSTTNFLATTNGSSWDITINFTTPLTAGAWNHVAIVRNGNVYTAYLNGVSNGTTTVSGTIVSGTAELVIGRRQGQTDYSGYISNFRIVKGTAVYTSGFTPPTSALTAITNTSLLTCQSNRFIDNSTNAFTITRNGDVSIQAFSPFAPSASYTTANVGGSVYLDGTGDYLTVPDSTAFTMGTGDFSVECWYYGTSSSRQIIASQSNNGGTTFSFWMEKNASNQLRCLATVGGVQYVATATATMDLNAWNFLQLVRSGTTLYGYQNGTQVCSVSVGSGSLVDSTDNVTIGDYGAGSGLPVVGYISSFRILKGTASSATTPAAPLTNIANTSLLCSFTNAQIFDQTAKNVLECIGDAKVSTSVYKYGSGSMYFDGTGDELNAYSTAQNLNALSGGDFTIEGWVNTSTLTPAASGYACIVGMQNYGGSKGWGIWQQNQTIAAFFNGGGLSVVTGNVLTATGTWYHIAVTRSSGNVRIFINGTLAAGPTSISFSDSTTTPLTVGGISSTSGWNANYPFYGYIDDLRITRGYARYTSNFTAPTTAFPNK